VPSLLVGAPQLAKNDERELAFEVAKRMAYLRPERFVTLAVGTLPKLESAFAAAIAASGVTINAHDGKVFDVESDEAKKLAAALQKQVPGPLLEQVGDLSVKLSGRVGNGLISSWRAATDLTANRVGLIVSNDLEVAAKAITDSWYSRARWGAILLAILLLGDAVLLPGLVRRQNNRELDAPHRPVVEPPPVVAEPVLAEDPTLHFHSRVTDAIETINVKAGEFVAWWSLIAVFVYYYEVIARFVFNSPTNWVHESMFLMFGMQYMISGAYAYREDQHVRVDVFYSKFSPRGKAIADVISSVFFFIFTITLLWTGWRFAADAVANRETSFTEWGIQYWPVKLTMPIGAALIILQGVSKLVKDILILTRAKA
jgi:TRAP-type mannitol/chloroaromatic compound transport system permease small subunit